MKVETAVEQYLTYYPQQRNEAHAALLAIRRAGITSIEELAGIYEEDPYKLSDLRGIGSSRLKLIEQVLRFQDSPDSG